jgi:hypothetical protein
MASGVFCCESPFLAVAVAQMPQPPLFSAFACFQPDSNAYSVVPQVAKLQLLVF